MAVVNSYTAITIDDGLTMPIDLPAQLQRMENQIATLTNGLNIGPYWNYVSNGGVIDRQGSTILILFRHNNTAGLNGLAIGNFGTGYCFTVAGLANISDLYVNPSTHVITWTVKSGGTPACYYITM